jgi:hypothetical protein
VLKKQRFVEGNTNVLFADEHGLAFFFGKTTDRSSGRQLAFYFLKMGYGRHDRFLRGILIKPDMFHNLRYPVLKPVRLILLARQRDYLKEKTGGDPEIFPVSC